MRGIKFGVSFILCLTITYLFNNSFTIKEMPVPAVGKLLNPFTGFWQNAAPVQNEKEEHFNYPGLEAPVTVTYDNRLVPHIFAQNIEDALFVQGVLLAKYRLWQMDISIRSAGGRLSEVMGERLLKRDQLQRRRGMVYAAENAVKSWKTVPEYKFVEAYTAGINAYINSLKPKDYPVEFKLLGYAPEPWSVFKSALFLKAMAQTLCSSESDIELTNARSLFDEETFNLLFPERHPGDSPIIPKSVEWEFEPITVQTPEVLSDVTTPIQHRAFPKPPQFLGSNNWAVAGSKTTTGYPILCSDPHLRLSLPSIWYELQIHTPNVNSYGVCLPGVPGITIGFNENIAWGMTNVGHDVLDWYTIKWADQSKETYWLDGKKEKVKKVVETYKVKGGKIITDTIRYTHWGPVVHESADNPRQDMAMRWVAHDEGGNELKVFYGLNSGKNYDDYVKAVESYDAPAQNIVFASKEGDIAIRVQGKFPLKYPGQGKFVQDGSKTSNGWQGFIPKSQVPAVKNPERQFVSSANQGSTDSTYPYYYNGMRNGFGDYRGRILNRKLAAMGKVSVEDMKALQNDTYGLKAEESLPPLLSLIDPNQLNEQERIYWNQLKDWNYEYEGELAAPVIFDKWYGEFYRQTWDEIYSLDDSLEMPFPRSFRTTEIAKNDPSNNFFDIKKTENLETATDIALSSFQKTAKDLKKWEDKGNQLKWSVRKNLNIQHLGFIDPFSAMDVEVEGDPQALNAISNWAGPSWRMVVSYGPDRVKAYGVYPGGQSGNPGSPYYDNMIDPWSKGKYFDLLLMKDKDEFKDQMIKTNHFAPAN